MVRKNRPLEIFRECDEAKSFPFRYPSNACRGVTWHLTKEILCKSLIAEKRQYRQCIDLIFSLWLVELNTRRFFFPIAEKYIEIH